MKIFIVFLLTFLQSTKVWSEFQSLEEVKNNCTPLAMPLTNFNSVMRGLPFSINCGTLADTHYVDYSGSNSMCQIWASNGTSLLFADASIYDFYEEENGVIDFPDVKTDYSNFTISLTVEDLGCFYLTYNLDIRTPETCEEFEANREPFLRPLELGGGQQRLTLNCEVYDDAYPKFPDIYESDYEYEWRRNCAGDVISTDKSLHFPDLTYEDGGEYICTVIYRGIRRAVAEYKVCLRSQPSFISTYHMTCENEILRKQVGDTATFSCRYTFANGKPARGDLNVAWIKKNINNSTIPCFESPNEVIGDPRNQCFVEFGEKCLNSTENVIPFTLTIRNIMEADFGNYSIMATSISLDQLNNTLTLLRNEIPELLTAAEITGICIAILFTFIVISLIIFYNFLYVKVYYKRWFAAVITNDKKYGVSLAYHFSREIDVFAQTTVKESIQKIRHTLEKMGYLVYDEKKNFNAKGKADNIHYSIENCHRVLILLSPEFIKDEWSLFALQEGFNEMVVSGTKLVFILLPGVKEYLKQKANDSNEQDSSGNGVYQMILRALKVNYVIQLPDQKRLSSKRFTFQLENALPKLPKVRMERLMSTSSGYSSLNQGENGQLKTQVSTMTTLSNELKEDVAV